MLSFIHDAAVDVPLALKVVVMRDCLDFAGPTGGIWLAVCIFFSRASTRVSKCAPVEHNEDLRIGHILTLQLSSVATAMKDRKHISSAQGQEGSNLQMLCCKAFLEAVRATSGDPDGDMMTRYVANSSSTSGSSSSSGSSSTQSSSRS